VASHPQQAAVPIRSANLPPTKPVFGLTLEQLFERDGSAVPMVVAQCIQAVDLFGLEVEGIYRLSGTSSHVNQIKAMFDHGEQHFQRALGNYMTDIIQMPPRLTSAIPRTSSTTSTASPVY
jgi:hypothetical protein